MGPFARDRLRSPRLNEDHSRPCSRCKDLLPKDSAGAFTNLALAPAGDFAKPPDGTIARRASPPAELFGRQSSQRAWVVVPFVEVVFPGSD